MPTPVLIDRKESVATVTLNNAAKLNAMNRDMWLGLEAAVKALSADDDVRCIILRGAGDQAFSAGADIEEFPRARLNGTQARAYAHVTEAAMQAMATCRHPTVAMIQGACVGGGLEIASVCDMRICGVSSRFGVPVNRLGLVMSYGELGGLVSLVGASTALEILLEGRVFGAKEALDKRLVNKVVEDAEVPAEVEAIARRISHGAPLVAQWHKKFIRRLADPAPLTEADRDEAYACFDTEDFRAGYQAFINKTRPVFKGK
jgi:enoyl-CoA hydratase